MIGEEEHHRFFKQSILLELAQDLPHLLIHRRDVVVGACQILTHEGRVRIIGRHTDMSGIGDLWITLRLGKSTALVRRGQIEDAEERLRGIGPITPVSLPIGLVPNRHRLAKLVVTLGGIGAVVTSHAQNLWEAAHLRGWSSFITGDRRISSGITLHSSRTGFSGAVMH